MRRVGPLGTDADKRYLEIAPWLIVVFRMTKTDDGGQVYYGEEYRLRDSVALLR